jgi:hypothetical protein
MISSLDIHHIKYDIVQYLTILSLSCIINYLFKGTELFNEEWNNVVIVTLIAVICSDIFITRLIKYCCKKVNNKILRYSIRDFLRYTTIFVFVQLTKNFVSYNSVCYTHYNFKFYLATLFGFIIYDIIYISLPNINIEHKYILEDITKLTFAIISVGIFADNQFEYKHLVEFLIIASSVIAFHSITKETLSVETIYVIEEKYRTV